MPLIFGSNFFNIDFQQSSLNEKSLEILARFQPRSQIQLNHPASKVADANACAEYLIFVLNIRDPMFVPKHVFSNFRDNEFQESCLHAKMTTKPPWSRWCPLIEPKSTVSNDHDHLLMLCSNDSQLSKYK